MAQPISVAQMSLALPKIYLLIEFTKVVSLILILGSMLQSFHVIPWLDQGIQENKETQ